MRRKSAIGSDPEKAVRRPMKRESGDLLKCLCLYSLDFGGIGLLCFAENRLRQSYGCRSFILFAQLGFLHRFLHCNIGFQGTAQKK